MLSPMLFSRQSHPTKTNVPVAAAKESPRPTANGMPSVTRSRPVQLSGVLQM